MAQRATTSNVNSVLPNIQPLPFQPLPPASAAFARHGPRSEAGDLRPVVEEADLNRFRSSASAVCPPTRPKYARLPEITRNKEYQALPQIQEGAPYTLVPLDAGGSGIPVPRRIPGEIIPPESATQGSTAASFGDIRRTVELVPRDADRQTVISTTNLDRPDGTAAGYTVRLISGTEHAIN